jgi:hypothetical protein
VTHDHQNCQTLYVTNKISPVRELYLDLSITGGHQHVEEEFYGVVGAVDTFWMTQSSCRPHDIITRVCGGLDRWMLGGNIKLYKTINDAFIERS